MRARSLSIRAISITVGVAILPGLILATAGTAAADDLNSLRVPDWVKTASKEGGPAVVAPSLRDASGTVTVSVAMSEKPIAQIVPEDALPDKTLPTRDVQRARTAAVAQQQNGMVIQARKLGARDLGRATKSINVVAMSVSAKNVKALAALPGVTSVKPVARYETHAGASGSLEQAADYLDVTKARKAGYDGTGVDIAVLDSGIDFTHANLGGPGTVAAYDTCYAQNLVAPSGACAALFGPGAPKVKGGYDFVGETWPNTAEMPDPNPIDLEGHGTHVSDIAAGKGTDHQGIAPGANVFAIKVCSAVATSCSGVAILQGIDWALDPNGDGDISDAVDIVNLSLGSAYGQAEDDSSVALDNLVRAGVVAVVSAGNSADRPFIVGSPSTAQRTISVAQTALPDDKLYSVKVVSPTIPSLPDNTIRNALIQTWSPKPTAPITAPLAQPTGNLEGCTTDTFAGFPAGAIALIKRGTCNASAKAQLAEAAGASAVILWNNVAGDPPPFSFGGGAPVTIPTYTIGLDTGTALSNAVTAGAVQVTLDPAATTSLTNTVVGSSSRGVAIAGKRAKPDIGAPGAWLSAEVGTGAAETNFGGTSGAAPVITGAAAIVLDRYPNAQPSVVKARLLNAASLANKTPDSQANLYASPISRIGAGEVRVNAAIKTVGVLRAVGVAGGNVGLGLPHLTTTTTYAKTMRLTNTGTAAKTYLIDPVFRDAADRRSGAVSIAAPGAVRVPARSTKDFTVRFTIDPKKLSQWPFTHSAGRSGDGAALNAPEFDGWIKAIATTETLHLGWTVLPHRSADVSAAPVKLTKGKGQLSLANASAAQDGRVNVYGLTGTSAKQPASAPGGPGTPGSNAAVVDLAAVGVRDDVSFGVLQFAMASYKRQLSPLYPAGYEVDIDTDNNGTVDYAVFQSEGVGFGASGLSLVNVVNLTTGVATPYYYTDSDFDSATTVFTVPLAALGLAEGSTFGFQVLAYDNYFSGTVTDAVGAQTWTVGKTAYSLAAGADELVVPAKRTTKIAVTKSTTPVISTQTGLLLLLDDAAKNDYATVPLGGGSNQP